jgi:hypothetical protein
MLMASEEKNMPAKQLRVTQLSPQEVIVQKIFLLRGHRVMLDKDLAVLYGIKPIRLREQVKRNARRFPSDFMFQLTKEEAGCLVSQNAIPSKRSLGGYLPYAFTEHGVLMLSSVLNSAQAIDVNITIVRVFVRLREILSTHKELAHRLDELEKKMSHKDDEIQAIMMTIRQLMSPKEKRSRVIKGFSQN